MSKNQRIPHTPINLSSSQKGFSKLPSAKASQTAKKTNSSLYLRQQSTRTPNTNRNPNTEKSSQKIDSLSIQPPPKQTPQKPNSGLYPTPSLSKTKKSPLSSTIRDNSNALKSQMKEQVQFDIYLETALAKIQNSINNVIEQTNLIVDTSNLEDNLKYSPLIAKVDHLCTEFLRTSAQLNSMENPELCQRSFEADNLLQTFFGEHYSIDDLKSLLSNNMQQTSILSDVTTLGQQVREVFSNGSNEEVMQAINNLKKAFTGRKKKANSSDDFSQNNELASAVRKLVNLDTDEQIITALQESIDLTNKVKSTFNADSEKTSEILDNMIEHPQKELDYQIAETVRTFYRDNQIPTEKYTEKVQQDLYLSKRVRELVHKEDDDLILRIISENKEMAAENGYVKELENRLAGFQQTASENNQVRAQLEQQESLINELKESNSKDTKMANQIRRFYPNNNDQDIQCLIAKDIKLAASVREKYPEENDGQIISSFENPQKVERSIELTNNDEFINSIREFYEFIDDESILSNLKENFEMTTQIHHIFDSTNNDNIIKQIQNAKSALSELTNQTEKQEKELNEQKQQIDQITQENMELKDRFENEFNTQKRQLDQISQEKVDLITQNEKIENELNNQKELNEQLNEQKGRIEDELNETKSQLNELQQHKNESQLIQNLHSLYSQHDDINTLVTNDVNLVNEIRKLYPNTNDDSIVNEINSNKLRFGILEQQLEEKTKQIDEMNSYNENRFDKQKEEIENLKNRLLECLGKSNDSFKQIQVFYPTLNENEVIEKVQRDHELSDSIRRLVNDSDSVIADRIEANQNEIDQLKDSNRALTQEFKQANDKNQHLENEIQEVKLHNDQLTSELTQVKESNGQLTSELTQVKERNGQLTSELSQVKESNGQLTSELSQVKENNGQLTSELTQVKENSQNELNQLKHNNEQLHSQVVHLKQDNEQLSTTLNQLKEQNQQTNTEHQNNKDQMITELDQLKHNNEQLHNELSESKQTIIELQNNNQQLTNELNQLRQQNEQLHDDLVQKQNSIDQLTKEKADSVQELITKQSMINELTTQNETEHIQKELNDLQQLHQQLQEQQKELNDRNDQLTSELTKQQNQLTESTKDSQFATSVRDIFVNNTDENILTFINKDVSLASQIRSIFKSGDDEYILGEVRSNSNSKSCINDKDNELNHIHSQLLQIQNELRNKQNEIDQKSTENNQLHQIVEKKQNEIDQLTSQIHEFTSQQNDINDQLNQQKEKSLNELRNQLNQDKENSLSELALQKDNEISQLRNQIIQEKENEIAQLRYQFNQEKENSLNKLRDQLSQEKENSLNELRDQLTKEKDNELNQQRNQFNQEKENSLNELRHQLSIEKENALSQLRTQLSTPLTQTTTLPFSGQTNEEMEREVFEKLEDIDQISRQFAEQISLLYDQLQQNNEEEIEEEEYDESDQPNNDIFSSLVRAIVDKQSIEQNDLTQLESTDRKRIEFIEFLMKQHSLFQVGDPELFRNATRLFAKGTEEEIGNRTTEIANAANELYNNAQLQPDVVSGLKQMFASAEKENIPQLIEEMLHDDNPEVRQSAEVLKSAMNEQNMGVEIEGMLTMSLAMFVHQFISGNHIDK